MILKRFPDVAAAFVLFLFLAAAIYALAHVTTVMGVLYGIAMFLIRLIRVLTAMIRYCLS